MDFVLQPWQLYFVILVGWVQRQQQEAIHYLIAENRVLKKQIRKKRILLNDDRRRRLAVKGKLLGRKRLQEIGTLFTPDTILRWHRTLVARRWDYSNRRSDIAGRPRVRQVIVDLILRSPKTTPVGDTTGFRARWPTWDTPSRTRRSEMSSGSMASNRHQIERHRPPGRRSCRPTGTCWRRSTSRPSKSEPRAAW